MPLRLALAALAALAACGPDGAPAPTGPPAPASAGVLPDTATVRAVSLETTAALLAARATAISPSVAIQTIDRWAARIDTVAAEGAEADTLAAIRGDLVTLRRLLQSSPLDGPAIGRTLGALSDRTGALAAPGTPLDRLAQALGAQGQRLAPADSTIVDAPDEDS